MASRPEQAEEVLTSIESSSRQAVVELHRLLGILRRDEQGDVLAPQPDLARVTDLVAQAGQGELVVELSIEGEPRSLPRTLEVCAYRVIQEALTNALKHSGGTRADVRLEYRPTELEIEVVDNGRRAADSVQSTLGGHGLIGMRERVGLHGGHLRAGLAPQGGFVVNATFPLEGHAA
jgi:signal transduction histidine kinase